MPISKLFVALVALSLSLGGCTLARVANTWVQSKAAFAQCTSDFRIVCEPGSEDLAKSIVPLLPDAIASVEKAQLSNFSSPIVIYTYKTRESFSTHSGAPAYAEGAVSLGTLNLSPKLLSAPERTKGILAHELSHLHLQLEMGSLAWARIPSWFHEGLATFVSNGGGAETVSAEEALVALSLGNRFEPDGSQWALFPKSASSYGIGPHLYYRQAALFVAFMHDTDPLAFEQLLRAIAAKVAFSEAIESSFHQALPAIWKWFLSNQSDITNKAGYKDAADLPSTHQAKSSCHTGGIHIGLWDEMRAGQTVARLKKLRDESRTNFSTSRVLSPHTAAHCAVAARGLKASQTTAFMAFQAHPAMAAR